jgi:hypothetical protein
MPEDSLSFERLLEILEQTDPSSRVHQGVAEVLEKQLTVEPRRFPTPTPRGRKRLLTIGLPTFNDYDGVYFSVQALRLYHPEITDVTEILVLDNDPLGPCAGPLKTLEDCVEGYRYYPYDSFHGTTVKDLLFREALGEFVLVMDSHVLFPPGSLAKLVDFLEGQRESKDLWQGPLLSDSFEPLATHFDSTWSGGMHGQWAWDNRASEEDAPPFEIPKQGMGVFACRREAWPGFNPRFQGFCCEEGYIHDKVRANGGRAMCLPFLRWLHRFERPGGVPYRPNWEDRIRNFLIGYDELGTDPAPAIEHFDEVVGTGAAQMVEAARKEIAGPYYQYDAIFGINGKPGEYEARTGSRVRKIRAQATAEMPEIGRAMAHREIAAEAAWQGLKKVLVLEENPSRETAYGSREIEHLLEMPETAVEIALWFRKHGGQMWR